MSRGTRATLRDLHAQLLPLVQDAARRQNRKQTPMLLGGKADLSFR